MMGILRFGVGVCFYLFGGRWLLRIKTALWVLRRVCRGSQEGVCERSFREA